MADEEKKIDPKLKLDNVRLSFPDIWEARSVKNSEPKFSAHFILDVDGHEELIKAIRLRIWAVAVEHWGREKAKKICGGKKFEMCLHDGEDKADMDGYGEGRMYLTSSSSKRPLVVDRDRSVLTKADARPYGGCFVNGIVRLWVQDNEFGQRVNAELMGVQFFKDGEPFGGSVPATPDDFEDLDDGKGKKKDKAAKGEKAKDDDSSSGGAAEPDEDEIPF